MVIGLLLLGAAVVAFGGVFFAAVFAIMIVTLLVKEAFTAMFSKPAD